MRLPEDDEEGAKVVRRAADLGINYFETSNWYCENRSEIKVGMGLKGIRDKVYISTKSKVNPGTTGDDVRRNVEQSLKQLGVDRVDFYQLWDYRLPDREPILAKGGGLDTLEKLRDEGIIGHIGITSHESNENILEMLETGRLESATIVFDLLRRDTKPVIEYAAKRGIGVVIMNPLAGGLLAANSDVIRNAVSGDNPSNVAAALRFAMSQPGVCTVACGMTSVAEVEENVGYWRDFTPLTAEEIASTSESLGEYQALGKQFCTGCGYCLPCPQGIRIPRLFSVRNHHKLFGLRDWAESRYKRIPAEVLPENCNECGECETKCPNKVPVIAQLKEVAELFKGVRD